MEQKTYYEFLKLNSDPYYDHDMLHDERKKIFIEGLKSEPSSNMIIKTICTEYDKSLYIELFGGGSINNSLFIIKIKYPDKSGHCIDFIENYLKDMYPFCEYELGFILNKEKVIEFAKIIDDLLFNYIYKIRPKSARN